MRSQAYPQPCTGPLILNSFEGDRAPTDQYGNLLLSRTPYPHPPCKPMQRGHQTTATDTLHITAIYHLQKSHTAPSLMCSRTVVHVGPTLAHCQDDVFSFEMQLEPLSRTAKRMANDRAVLQKESKRDKITQELCETGPLWFRKMESMGPSYISSHFDR